MAGIDNTLITHLGTKLWQNCQVHHFVAELLYILAQKDGEKFAYGRDHHVAWIDSHNWAYSIGLNGDHRLISQFDQLKSQAGEQPLPSPDYTGYTFESHLYRVLLEGARCSGASDEQAIQRILMGCAEYHLPEFTIAQLRQCETLEDLLRLLVTTARDAYEGCVSRIKPFTQRYLMQFSGSDQMPNGFLEQTLTDENGSFLMSIREVGKGAGRYYSASTMVRKLMGDTRCLLLLGEGGMGKTTFLQALHTLALLEHKPSAQQPVSRKPPTARSAAFASVFQLPMATVTDETLRAFRRVSQSFGGSLILYCICWGNATVYRTRIAEPLAGMQALREKGRLTEEKRQPVLLLLDSLHEAEGSEELHSCIADDLERLSQQPDLCLFVTSRLPMNGTLLRDAFRRVHLAGTPAAQYMELRSQYQLPDELLPMLRRPLYYNLFHRLLGSRSSSEVKKLVTSYALFTRVFEEDVKRQLSSAPDAVSRTQLKYILISVLPQLACRMGHTRGGMSYEGILSLLTEISAELTATPVHTRLLHEQMTGGERYAAPSCIPDVDHQLMRMLEFGWIVYREGAYAFCHQEHQDFLTARLLLAQMHCIRQESNHPSGEPRPVLSLNRPRSVISMLCEGLSAATLEEGVLAYAQGLPEIEYPDELTPGVVAYADAVRQLGEYLRLPVKQYAPLLLPLLRRVVDCLSDASEEEVVLPPESMEQLLAVMQKTAQYCRNTGDYAGALRLLDGWDSSLALRHARAKLLLESAMAAGPDFAVLEEGLALLHECADAGYYFSCSLQGLLLSAPHPLLLQRGLIRRNITDAAATYLRGCRDAAHQGYDVVYIVRNLLTMFFCGKVSLAGQPTAAALMEEPDVFLKHGSGEYLRRTPRFAKELLERFSRYDSKRCAFPLGCSALNDFLRGKGDRDQVIRSFMEDGSLASRLLLQAFLDWESVPPEDYLKPLRNADGSFLTAADMLARPLDQYPPLCQYLDARQLSIALGLGVDFCSLEAALPEDVRTLLQLYQA